MHISARNAAAPIQSSNARSHEGPDMPTPIQPIKLAQLLNTAGYDNSKIAFLIEGFTQGFSLGVKGDLEESIPKNLVSSLEHPVVVSDKINKEL